MTRPTYLDGHLGKIAGPSEPSTETMLKVLAAAYAATLIIPLIPVAIYVIARCA